MLSQVKEMDENVVALYVDEVENVVIEDDNATAGLSGYKEKRIVAEENARYFQAKEVVEEAKDFLAIEACGRQIAELNALKESLEKQKIEQKPGVLEKGEDIFRCLCYHSGWHFQSNAKMRIIDGGQSSNAVVPLTPGSAVFEVACGLAFLHSSKPDPIVQRDLKSVNILLDMNYVSKIREVGLANLFSDVVPGNMTGVPRFYSCRLATCWDTGKIALKCSSPRCRDGPNLDAEVLPVLRRLAGVAAASAEVERSKIYTPGH
ncbi:hypothetical protein SADUNF_Sadunf06G0121000 [Salix dunnii]|uniref:RING-type E3 ubiquitin transferase n=1 Tax=Salix dunnii TaxID=1413687 RepID=A0A835N0P6_9ROSI|nr:hypothetical protein SADUNF_Sadunf06G0121000 [Salix dunnii]